MGVISGDTESIIFRQLSDRHLKRVMHNLDKRVHKPRPVLLLSLLSQKDKQSNSRMLDFLFRNKITRKKS